MDLDIILKRILKRGDLQFFVQHVLNPTLICLKTGKLNILHKWAYQIITEHLMIVFRDVMMRQYVVDGNFTAQHMKMNKPQLDVALSDGRGYMVSEAPYSIHLLQSLDNKEVTMIVASPES